MTMIHPVYEPTPKNVTSPSGSAMVDKRAAKEFSKLKDDLLKLENAGKSPGPDLHQELLNMQRRFLSGAALTPQELISYQIKANQFGMRIELASKISESAVATIRRLQNPQ